MNAQLRSPHPREAPIERKQVNAPLRSAPFTPPPVNLNANGAAYKRACAFTPFNPALRSGKDISMTDPMTTSTTHPTRGYAA